MTLLDIYHSLLVAFMVYLLQYMRIILKILKSIK